MHDGLARYRREFMAGDGCAGIVVAVMLVPQSMAYAMIAGLPPETGLYASILPVYVYALVGSSRILAVGPVAILSLMVGSVVSQFAAPDSVEFLKTAHALAWMSGAFLLLFAALRLGDLANFLSHSVISGFINAAALVIAASQMKNLLGLHTIVGDGFVSTVEHLWAARATINPVTAMLGTGAVLLLLSMRWPLGHLLARHGVSPRIVAVVTRTGALTVIVLGGVLVWLFQLDTLHGVRIVGNIPGGLPGLALPDPDHVFRPDLLPGAILTALVCYLESISVARSLASKRRERIRPNRELAALGLANLAAGLSATFPVAGGVSRSGVNFSAGAHTQVASVITATIIAITLLTVSQYLFFVPIAVLSAVVLIAVLRLVDVESLLHAWKYNKTDAVSGLLTFAGVLAYNVQTGIVIGLGFSLCVLLWRTLHPHIAVLGRVPGTEQYRNVLRHAVTTCPHVLALRIDESLYFANVHALEEMVLETTADRAEIRDVVLVFSAVNFIDANALEVLTSLREQLHDSGVTLHLAEVKELVMDGLASTSFLRSMGEGRVFMSAHEAMNALNCI